MSNHKPQNNKSLGQHWLKDRGILNEIAKLSIPDDFVEELSAKDKNTPSELTCLEIGPGLGTLTSSLLKIYPKVVAVEFDEKLAHNLPNSFPGKNLEVINADFLKFDLSTLPKNYVVCANIPYYITSPIITKLLEAENPPKRIVILIQKEVAERIAAGDNPLALFVENRADISLGPVVKKEYFTPPPKVDSEIIILDPHTPKVSGEVLKLIRAGFSNPRKKLIKNLSAYGNLKPLFEKLSIAENARPGDLNLENWQELQEAICDKL